MVCNFLRNPSRIQRLLLHSLIVPYRTILSSSSSLSDIIDLVPVSWILACYRLVLELTWFKYLGALGVNWVYTSPLLSV